MVFTNVYNPRALIDQKSEYRNTIVRRGATLGANCTVACGVEIGKFAFIGAGALVQKDVADYELVLGVPGRRVVWMSELGERLDLSVEGNQSAVCPVSGETYLLKGQKVSKLGS